jgi:ATP-dependent Lon protease
LSQLTEDNAFSATPLLISGPPGVGKTAFCRAFANIVRTHFECIGMSGLTAGFVLGGMSSSWADGKPGKIVEALARGHKANPLILLDEIDKVTGDHRYDPLGALYQLLEKETAATFIDEGLEVAVNCTHIVWVATANELQHIPEPILSRFAVVEVRQPSRSQMGKVVQSIYKKIRREHDWGRQFTEQLPNKVIDKIISSGLAPRLIQRELISACGRAVLSKSKFKQHANGSSQYVLSPNNFQLGLTGAKEIRMGFVQ